MGRDKATLPFGPELMLQRVVRLLSEVVEPARIVVVASAEQSLPPLPAGVIIARDAQPERGPLEGLAAGLRAIAGNSNVVYATACDVPLLSSAFVERMFGLMEDFDIVVPYDGQHHHPLSAVYRTRVLEHVEKLLAADRLSPRMLFSEVRTREAPVEELRTVDPELRTLTNLNDPEEYQAALAAAGFRIS
jgi:molybdopterin-guanine dinucleotide biosynthesis protein A